MPTCSLILLPIIILSFTHLAASQQSYSPSVCRNSTSALGYACNGLKNRCETYLIFRAQPPYNNASSIASLLGSNKSQIARLNNISETAVLPTRKELIIPITCSCSGAHYQSNTTYVVRRDDTPYLIANATFEGATTCKAIQHQRSGLVVDIFPDETLTIPLRCACPTANQSRAGINYLLTYVIKSGDSISAISLSFGARDIGETLLANQKSVPDSIIQPFTTLLVPLRTPPNNSMTVTPNPTQTPSPITASPPPLASIPVPGSTKKWNYFLYGLIAGGGFVLVLGSITFSLLGQRRKTRKAEVKPIVSKSCHVEVEIQQPEFLDNIARSLKVYSFEELRSATDDFSPVSVIGGSVYRGIMEQRRVAIKKTQGDVSREMEILNKMNHFNIITLLGVCYNNSNSNDSGVWYMVYEYVPNGRLSDWIYQSGEEDGSKTTPLCWEKRVQIALDVATGLHYLHGYTNPPLIHKDLKCSHVLLDEEWRAKISHFGLSKSVGEQDAGLFALTNHIVGTKGYMAPEYLQNGLVTPKMDVYAFGILLVEILTGIEADLLCAADCVPLSDILNPLLSGQSDCENKLRDFMDPRLQQNYPKDVVTAVVRLADKCVSKDPSGRPAMDDVVRLLSKALTWSVVWASSTTSNSISSHATTTRIAD